MRTGRLITMHAQPGRGAELAEAMLQVAKALEGAPGCEIYVVSYDKADPDTVHITEVWADETSADAALASGEDFGRAQCAGCARIARRAT